MTFAPLQTSTHNDDPVVDSKAQRNKSCSARSMYSLASVVGAIFDMNLPLLGLTGRKLEIESIKEDALKDIQSKLCTSNIAQELFTSFALKWVPTSPSTSSLSHLCTFFSHKAIMNMEIDFYRTSTGHDPKLIIGHIHKMTSAEIPFFSTKLSLIYDTLVEKIFAQPATSGSILEKSAKSGEQSAAEPAATVQAPNPSDTPLPPSPQAPDSLPEAEPISTGAVWLECFQCNERARLQDLYHGLRCPRCPPRTRARGRPFMQCPSCNLVRGTPKDHCVRATCQARFV